MHFLEHSTSQEAISNKCIATSNRCLTSSNKKLDHVASSIGFAEAVGSEARRAGDRWRVCRGPTEWRPDGLRI